MTTKAGSDRHDIIGFEDEWRGTSQGMKATEATHISWFSGAWSYES